MKEQEQKTADLGSGKVGRLLFRLAVPAITAQLVNMLYNIVDRMYIGHIPEIGAAALTGVGVTFPILMIISAFSSLIGMGGAPRASIKMGQKDVEGAEKILGNCFVTLVGISIILTVLFLILGEDLLLLFGASENTIAYGTQYLTIYVSGTIFVRMALGLNTFISAQGFAKTSMMTVIIGAISNIILDPIFIFVLDMGVRGAAVATIIFPGNIVGLGRAIFVRSENSSQNPERKFCVETFRYAAGSGVGGVALYYAEYGESSEYLFELVATALWRGSVCGGHDHHGQCHADSYDAVSGAYPGGAADYQF